MSPLISPKELFAALGLPTSATEAEVKRAYRNLARLHHPDKAGQDAVETMKQINLAYELITDRKLCKPQRASTSPGPNPHPPQPQPQPQPQPAQRSASALTPTWTPDRHRWSAPPLGTVHRKLTAFIMDDAAGVDPRTKRRGRESSTYRAAEGLHFRLYQLRGLNDTRTAPGRERADLGELLNQILLVMVADAETLDEARSMFKALDLEAMLARVGIEIDAGDLPAVRSGWDCRACNWGASWEEVWRNAQRTDGSKSRFDPCHRW